MCGVLGILGGDPGNRSRERFVEALTLQAHRGPDDSDTLFEERFWFGHRRLSIIDLSTDARQPMTSDDGMVSIVFNGEIYNYRELRAELTAAGYTFRTTGDTEVLLYSYHRHGIQCLERFNGMFAFGLYDRRNDRAYLVRDRLGIKPLYYRHDGDRLVFSSEIKSILHLGDSVPSLNLDAVSSYLSFRYPILHDTFFEDIESLPPGHFLEYSAGAATTTRYWNPAHCFSLQAEEQTEEFYGDRLVELLKKSVEYRMISDVPVGAYLSGGVDSSVITALMAQHSPSPVKTFTVGFDVDGYNEFPYAQLVADRYGTEHREIVLSATDYVTTMEKLIRFKDAPLAVPNEVPLHLMSKRLREYITVVLSGEGADEIFGGYGRIFRSPDDLRTLRELDARSAHSAEEEAFLVRAMAKYGTTSFNSELSHFMRIYSYTDYQTKTSLLHPDLDLGPIENRLRGHFQQIFDEVPGASYLDRMMYAFERVHIVGLLHRVDMATMATSVEARVPFVDHELVEFAFSIPRKYKLKWRDEAAQAKSKHLLSDEISEVHDVPKYILKKSFEDTLPHEVLYRKKMGFPVPLDRWFGGSLNAYARDLLLSSDAATRDIVNQKTIRSLVESEHLASDHGLAMMVWMLVNLELFCRTYMQRPG